MGGNLNIKKGLDFEKIVRRDLKKDGYLVDKLHDAPPPYAVKKPSDLYVYKYPYFMFIECKKTQKNLWNIKSGLRDNQLEMMLNATRHKGVLSFIFIWFAMHNFIYCIDVNNVNDLLNKGYKSINIKHLTNNDYHGKIIHEEKGRKAFDLINFERELNKNE